jgi:hypothetical protein
MKNILQGLGVIFTLIATFLGLMYFLKGDIIVSSLVTCVIVVFEFFLIQQFITNKNEISKNRFSVLSIMLWTIYLILAVPMTFALLHALNVEINAKKDIQAVANTKILDLDKMVSVYNTQVDAYLTKKRTDLKTSLSYYAADPSSEKKEALKKPPFNVPSSVLNSVNEGNVNSKSVSLINADQLLFSKIVKDSITPEITYYKEQYGAVFDNWSRLHLNYAFFELDRLLEKNHNRLTNSFKTNAPGQDAGFQFAYTKDQTYINDPLALWSKHKPYYLLLVVIFFHVLILLPYFMEPVSGIYRGATQKGTVTSGGIEL